MLSAYVAAKESDAAYEALCKFYVALTRAKRAMYVITEPVGSSLSQNFPKLLERTLGDSWAVGDPSWFVAQSGENKSESLAAELAQLPESAGGRVVRLQPRRPSDAGPKPERVALFGSDGPGAAEFGRQVHALFETVEWWGESLAPAWMAARKEEGADPVALLETWTCLQSPVMAPVFTRPNGKTEVWRERAFEVVLDGAWLSGVFDRVMIERDATGRAARAWVVDFKTDRRRERADVTLRAVKQYASQLGIYRRAAAVLTRLPARSVCCTLVLTAACELVEVPFGD